MRGRPGTVLAVPDSVEGIIAVPLIISSVKWSLFGNMGLKHSGTLPQSNAKWHCLCGLPREWFGKEICKTENNLDEVFLKLLMMY